MQTFSSEQPSNRSNPDLRANNQTQQETALQFNSRQALSLCFWRSPSKIKLPHPGLLRCYEIYFKVVATNFEILSLLLFFIFVNIINIEKFLAF